MSNRTSTPWYIITYTHCGETWDDEWSCICDSECPVCGADIEASSWIDADEEYIYENK